MAVPQPGMKKRQVIANSNRTMFLWIAVISAFVGVCAVVAYFLFQQIIFRGKVAGELENTARILDQNNKNANSLIQNVQVLETNAALNSVKANADEKALQVVLDALPADPNTLALGASLQQSLTSGIKGLSVESLVVVPYSDDASSITAGTQQNTLPFILSVRSKDANALKELLRKFERSIRTIDIDSMTVERSDNGYTMTVQAHAYYQPATTVELTDKVVKP